LNQKKKNEHHPRIKLKIHNWESAASVQPLVTAAAAAGPTLGVLRSGGSARSSNNSSSGTLLRAWDAAVSMQGFILVDVTRAVGACLAIKDDEAIVRTAAAGRVACRALCDGVTRLVEAAFDADREERATHDALAQQIDALMCDALAPHCARAVPKLKDINDSAAKRCAAAAAIACGNSAATARSTRLVESCYFPIVTSGGACTTDAGAASDADAINDDVVVVEFGARFANYCTNVARTFFVEPLPSLEKCYAALRGIHTACVDVMRDGHSLSAVAAAAYAYLEAKDLGHLTKFLPKHNFGFALGLDFRDDDLVLTRNNPRNFQARMIFNLAIGLHNVPLDASERRKARGAIRELKKISMLLADTVLVQSAGAPPIVLTDFSVTRPALKDWREVSNLATSQRERAAVLAAQRAAAAEAELLAQLDAEDIKGNQISKKAKKSKKKQASLNDTVPITVNSPAPAPDTIQQQHNDDIKIIIQEESVPTIPATKFLSQEKENNEDDDDDDDEDEEIEAEAAQLLERVRAAGRSRWCESCEAAVNDAREYLKNLSTRAQQSSTTHSISALEKATRELAESMIAWRGIEKLLENAKSIDALKNALNKASSAGFPAKATAVKRARRRLKELESGPIGDDQLSKKNTLSNEMNTSPTNSFDGARPLSPTSTLERETKAQIQLGVAASQQAFTEIVAPNKRSSNNKERTPKIIDELSKYFHGDEIEIAQLREQRMDLTKLVLLAGRGAPKLVPWKDSQPPNNAVAVGRVLGLLRRLAPRVFVNLNAAERSGLLVRGGSPPREWLALAHDPGDNALDDSKFDAAVMQAAAQAAALVANKQFPEIPKNIYFSDMAMVSSPNSANQQQEVLANDPKRKKQAHRIWNASGPSQQKKTSPSQDEGSVLSDSLDVDFPISMQFGNNEIPNEPSLGPLISISNKAPPASPPRRTFTKSPEEGFMAPPGVPSQRQSPFTGGSLEWHPSSGIESPNAAAQQAAQAPSTLTSSWDATPDSFLAARDELSAMAGAAYAAALGEPKTNNPPPATRRIVGSGLLGSEQSPIVPPGGPAPGVFLANSNRQPPHRVQSLPGVLGNDNAMPSPLISSSSISGPDSSQALYGLGSSLGHLVLSADDSNSPQSLGGGASLPPHHNSPYDNGSNRGSFFVPAPMGAPSAGFNSQPPPTNIDPNRRRRRSDDLTLGHDPSLIDRGGIFVSGLPNIHHLGIPNAATNPNNHINSQFNDFSSLGVPPNFPPTDHLQPPPGVTGTRRRADGHTSAPTDFISGQPFFAPPSAVD